MRAVIEEIRHWFIASDGYIGVLDAGDRLKKRKYEAEEEVVRLLKEVNKLRDMRGDSE